MCYLDLKGRLGGQTHILSITHSRFIDKVRHAIFCITTILLKALHKLYLTQSNNFRKIIYKFAFFKRRSHSLDPRGEVAQYPRGEVAQYPRGEVAQYVTPAHSPLTRKT